MAEAIKVAIRTRPLNSREKDLDCDVIVAMNDKTVTVQVGKTPKHFTYDYTYWSLDPADSTFASQADVFSDIGSKILENATNGFNATLFAYGQTGSGKSYTMMGPDDDPGVIPQMVRNLFKEKLQIEQDPNQEFQVRISYLEIYKEQIHDLFGTLGGASGQAGETLKVMEHPNLGVYVKGLSEIPCENEPEVMKNLDYGLKMRTIAATNMNQNSSRSHAVFTVLVSRLEGQKPKSKKDKDERKALTAKINLIDLAGSERTSKSATENERLKEGCAINQSLSQLGMVIKMLAEKTGKDKANQIPFRASKLTFLLKDSLAGNSKTWMMAAISPASDNMDETLSTLRFASSVKTIQTVAVQNKDKKDQLIEKLQQEMRAMKAAMLAGGLDLSMEEVSEQLRENERLIEQEKVDFKDQLQVAREMQKAREEILKENGLSQQNITQAFGIDAGTPYLVNMAFDPMLAGCLIYLIKESEPTTIGAHEENSITLKGLGVTDHLCRIENHEGRVTIAKLGADGRVGINGKTLSPGQPKEIFNGDKIALGRNHALRLVRPQEGNAEPLPSDQLVLQDEEEVATLDDSKSWESLELYVDQVLRQSQLSQKASQKFVKETKTACRLVDEANEITDECWNEVATKKVTLLDKLKKLKKTEEDAEAAEEPEKRARMQFEVDLTSAVPPCVVIRVLQCPWDKDAEEEESWETKYLWSVSQLQERVERMRDYWTICKDSGKLDLEPLEDPWKEADPMEVVQRIRHLQTLAEEAFKALMPRLGVKRNDFRDDVSVLRMFFSFWKASIAAWKREKKGTSGRTALVKDKSGRGMRATIVAEPSLGPRLVGKAAKEALQAPEPEEKELASASKWSAVRKVLGNGRTKLLKRQPLAPAAVPAVEDEEATKASPRTPSAAQQRRSVARPTAAPVLPETAPSKSASSTAPREGEGSQPKTPLKGVPEATPEEESPVRGSARLQSNELLEAAKAEMRDEIKQRLRAEALEELRREVREEVKAEVEVEARRKAEGWLLQQLEPHRRFLQEVEEERDLLRKQLEVSWDLCAVLREQLIQACQPPPPTRQASPREVPRLVAEVPVWGAKLLEKVDALAEATKVAVASSRSPQDVHLRGPPLLASVPSGPSIAAASPALIPVPLSSSQPRPWATWIMDPHASPLVGLSPRSGAAVPVQEVQQVSRSRSVPPDSQIWSAPPRSRSPLRPAASAVLLPCRGAAPVLGSATPPVFPGLVQVQSRTLSPCPSGVRTPQPLPPGVSPILAGGCPPVPSGLFAGATSGGFHSLIRPLLRPGTPQATVGPPVPAPSPRPDQVGTWEKSTPTPERPCVPVPGRTRHSL